MSKKYFRVEATMSTYLFIDVEAENESEARDKAENIDGGVFIESNQYGGWDITDANEIRADQIQNLVTPDEEEEEVA